MKKPRYYTAAATRELDRRAIEEHNIPGFELMQRAGKAAFNALLQNWPDIRKTIILCGTGNNGGDGFIIAGLAKTAGLEVDLFVAGDISSIKGDALKALDYALNNGTHTHPATKFYTADIEYKNRKDSGNTILVDALLGTGLSGKVREPFTQLINQINACNLPVLAVDIPSGLCSDTGKILGVAVKADLTITFIGRKIGLIRRSGPELTGKLLFDDLNLPEVIYSNVLFSK
ncbi:MAG: NAD(P)H-hydrate epimerase [SAR86 cluster bacterium]|uniref:NAD(P)H-hydrate epimerase n=1 Tax=SAR86 cluster bacterium TaxID=2030880 RepID=A0A2A5CII9_9GAMM|nr:MAG: NAD(P)H-hydrate epimerase [SAR86 cluster bacterium]